MDTLAPTTLNTSWKVAKLHGVLMVIAGLIGFISLDPNTNPLTSSVSISAYTFLIIIGCSCFFIKKKRVIALSIISLFATLYGASFWITNEYYLPIGAFIIYIDLIMITTIFFGKKAGLVSMITIMSLLLFWLYLIDIKIINPEVSTPNAGGNAIFNGFLFGYFFLVAGLFKENITQQFRRNLKSEKKVLLANNARANRISDLKNKLGQIYEVHETHIVAIKLYVEKFNIKQFENYQKMKDDLNNFLHFIDKEITKINTLLNIENKNWNNSEINTKDSEIKIDNNFHKVFYKITIFFSIWLSVLHFNDLGWFNWLLIINAIICTYIYFKHADNLLLYTIFINFNISMVFVSLLAFSDNYNGVPVVFATSIYLALAAVYVFGFKRSIPLLILFSLVPYFRILLVENGYIEHPIIINIVGFDLFLNLFPIMVFAYILTATYLDDVDTYFTKLQQTYQKLQEISVLDKKEEDKLREIIDGISDLSNYNSHQVRAPIARLSGIINLYLTLDNDINEFEKATGHSLPTLIQGSLNEFEIAFSEFDSRLNSYRSLERESA